MSFKPRRMISFKHDPHKNGDDVEMSKIKDQEELEAEQDEFKQFLFSKRAIRPSNVIISDAYMHPTA